MPPQLRCTMTRVNCHCFAMSLTLMFAFPSDRPPNFPWDKILVSNGSVFSLFTENQKICTVQCHPGPVPISLLRNSIRGTNGVGTLGGNTWPYFGRKLLNALTDGVWSYPRRKHLALSWEEVNALRTSSASWSSASAETTFSPLQTLCRSAGIRKCSLWPLELLA